MKVLLLRHATELATCMTVRQEGSGLQCRTAIRPDPLIFIQLAFENDLPELKS